MLDAVKRILSNQRGEVPGTPDPPVSSGDWRAPFQTDTALAPIVAKMTEPDLPSVLKSYDGLKAHMGKAVFVKNAKDPDEVKQARARAYELGLFPKPPEAPDKYTFKRPDNIPEAAWSSELDQEYRNWAHKWGLPDEAMAEGLALNQKQFSSVVKGFEVDHAEAAEELRTWAEELRKEPAELMELGDEFIRQLEKSPRMAKYIAQPAIQAILKTPDGMKLFGTAALYSAQSSGVTGDGPNVKGVADLKGEVDAIMFNPNHPKYQLFANGDKATHEYVQGLYAKIYPGEKEL